MILGKYKNEDLVLIGIPSGGLGKEFKVSKTFVEVDVILDDNQRYILETCGVLSIMKLDDAVRLIMSIDDNVFSEIEFYSYVILHKYTGDINLSISDENGSNIKFTSIPSQTLIGKYPNYLDLSLDASIDISQTEYNHLKNFDYVL